MKSEIRPQPIGDSRRSVRNPALLGVRALNERAAKRLNDDVRSSRTCKTGKAWAGLAALIAALLGAISSAQANPLPDTRFNSLGDALSGEVIEPKVVTDVQKDGEVDALVVLERGGESPPFLPPAGAEGDVDVVREHESFPVVHVRVRSGEALLELANERGVQSITADKVHYLTTTQSMPLVGRNQAYDWGARGGGTSMAILDSGVDFTRPKFGACAAAGAPGCVVRFAADFAPPDGSLDDTGHGTDVAFVAQSVAPQAGILSLDVCNKGKCLDSSALDAIDWAIMNQAAYNIRAINMSFATRDHHTSSCGDPSRPTPFQVAVFHARGAGILPVAGAGNWGFVNGSFVNGIGHPACLPGVLSVGATYDANLGAVSFTNGDSGTYDCTDATPARDQVACFSSSAPILSVFAPGAVIQTFGAPGIGTSLAAPHVTGTVAALASAEPTATPGQIQSAIENSGPAVTDSRNCDSTGICLTKRRLHLPSALRALVPTPNDSFAVPRVLAGSVGAVEQRSWSATKEPNEPSHADNFGGQSVWFRWSAPVSGPVAVRTDGSNFDTLLAVYVGSALGALTPVAKNDNCCPGALDPITGLPYETSRVVFNAFAGTTYMIAVDGHNGGTGALSGTIRLSWDARPPNDGFNAAETISGTGRWEGFNVGATKQPGEPDHCGNEGGASVWYRWTAPFSESVDVAAAGDLGFFYRPCITVYQGSWGALTKVAGGFWASNDHFWEATFDATAGTSYLIAVEGLTCEEIGVSCGPATGTFTLSVERSARIVFASDRHGNLEIYSMKPNGTDLRRLTSNMAPDLMPAWSSDRAKIAFASLRDGNYEIYTMNADGTGQTRVTTNASLDMDPAWSPDGSTIAFSSNRSGDNEIYLMDPAGASQARLTNRPGDDLHPAWSPDGSRIAVAQYRGYNGQYGPGYDIGVINREGNTVDVGGTTFGDDAYPSWSPSGSTLVFSSQYEVSEGLGSWLFKQNDDGSVSPISSGWFDVAPAWGPQGKIAFEVVNDVDDSDVYLMAPGVGGSRVNLTQNAAWDGQPDWR